MFGLVHHDVLSSTFNDLEKIDVDSWLAYSSIQKFDSGYEITVELPGLSRSDIDIEVTSSALMVTASRENRSTMYNNFVKSSNSSQEKMKYTKSWRLPDETNFEGIAAKYDAGILRIEVPVKRPNKRKISVE